MMLNERSRVRSAGRNTAAQLRKGRECWLKLRLQSVAIRRHLAEMMLACATYDVRLRSQCGIGTIEQSQFQAVQSYLSLKVGDGLSKATASAWTRNGLYLG